MKFILLASLFFTSIAFSKKAKINYEYKKYERFDFEALDVQGKRNTPGDLSIGSRFGTQFKNKIPEKPNFNREMRKAIDSIL